MQLHVSSGAFRILNKEGGKSNNKKKNNEKKNSPKATI
jgi:hypothetical protein